MIKAEKPRPTLPQAGHHRVTFFQLGDLSGQRLQIAFRDHLLPCRRTQFEPVSGLPRSGCEGLAEPVQGGGRIFQFGQRYRRSSPALGPQQGLTDEVFSRERIDDHFRAAGAIAKHSGRREQRTVAVTHKQSAGQAEQLWSGDANTMHRVEGCGRRRRIGRQENDLTLA